jgi:hypothetical protein
MTTPNLTQDLRDPCANAFERASARTHIEEINKKRTTFLAFLFKRRGEELDPSLAGREMPPFMVYTPGGSYFVSDTHRNLAAAAHPGAGLASAEITDNPRR